MINQASRQLDLPVQKQILNISVNMARMGELVLKHGTSRGRLIERFLDQTDSYLTELFNVNTSEKFKHTLIKFNKEFKKLKKIRIGEKNKLLWAEKAITWADILQIRSKLV